MRECSANIEVILLCVCASLSSSLRLFAHHARLHHDRVVGVSFLAHMTGVPAVLAEVLGARLAVDRSLRVKAARAVAVVDEGIDLNLAMQILDTLMVKNTLLDMERRQLTVFSKRSDLIRTKRALIAFKYDSWLTKTARPAPVG